ncbi:hypothetical protein M3P21_10190 [Ruegeria sp. 2012CJ41-6]|uniref:Uncharacterized protein n=1 Tax=Ruegeria spongiae TaxID=2942209 RepID=A0ABT0Q1Z4_9RHOB|nr:hypothetical protein [Ruegeria spongiae]MCL6283899.1 hypothetical protein [Ruegeria spongiae]
MFGFLDMKQVVNMLHSTDLVDMRDAILSDDEDGPDGGSPCAREEKVENDANHDRHVAIPLYA